MPKKERAIVRGEHLEVEPLLKTIDEGTEAACALLCGAYIENATGGLLQRVMIDDERSNYQLNDPNGFLSSAGARNTMCFCLGLIDRELHTTARHIAIIRNLFAHSHVPIAFDDPEVTDACNGLNAYLADPDQPGKKLLGEKRKRLLANKRRKLVYATGWAYTSILVRVGLFKGDEDTPKRPFPPGYFRCERRKGKLEGVIVYYAGGQ